MSPQQSDHPPQDGQRKIGIADVIEYVQNELIPLKKESEIFRQLFASVPDYIYVKDIDGRHVMVNQADAELKGARSPDEVIGKTDFDFYPTDIASKFFNDEQDIIRTGKSVIDRTERVINMRTGEVRRLSTTKVPWISNGEIKGIIGIGRDITERKDPSVLDLIVGHAVVALKAQNGGLYRYHPEDKLLRLIAHKDRPNVLGSQLDEDEGIAGYLIQTGFTECIVPNYNQWTGRIDRHAQTQTLGAVLGVLLKVGDTKIGVLYINDAVGRHFTFQDVALLQLFGEQAVNAIQDYESYGREYLRYSEKLAVEHLRTITSDYRKMAETIIDSAMVRVGGDGGKVYLMDDSRDNLRLIAIRGRLKEVFKPGSLLSTKEGLAGYLVQSGEPFAMTNDYANSPYRAERLVPYVSAVMEVPVNVAGEIVGVIGVFADGQHKQFVEERDLPPLMDLAQQSATILQNARKYESDQRRIRNLEIVEEIYKAMASNKAADEILGVIVKAIAVKFECTHCTIFLAEPRGDTIKLIPRATESTIPGGYTVTREFGENEDSIASLVYRTGTPQLLSNATTHEFFGKPTRNINKPRSMLVVPIKDKGRIVGVISADQDIEAWFTDYDRDLLMNVAENVAVTLAVEKAMLSMTTQNPARTKVFVSYSRQDSDWLKLILDQLAPVTRKGSLNIWVDTKDIKVGAVWEKEIDKALKEAKIAVILVSRNFAASPFIIDRELPIILKAASSGEMKLVWVAVSPALYDRIGVSKYHCANDPAHPLDTLSEKKRDEAIVDICRKIIDLYEHV